MFVLVTYDVSTIDKAGARRLRRVAQACEDYGQRVQKSVFECKVNQRNWVMLKSRLLHEIDEHQDSLRFYFLEVDTSTQHFGINKPVDLEDPLVF
ncbi:MAG: CRISPR-associated endonuclease Cas2 [Pyrinomonadaceae bacterium]|nr:CRISPR-associated endonuclease Cas2 [Pyrinomonadaceae bacterium]